MAEIPLMEKIKRGEYEQVVLLLQGGGALGAYQVGAFEVLSDELSAVKKKIDWVAGISIGAINASVIAAPRSGDAVAELESLWDDILLARLPPFDFNELCEFLPSFSHLRQLQPKYLNWSSMALPLGLANFFTSRVMSLLENPWFLQWFRELDRNELAFYDTEPLRETLVKHVDFTRLGHTQLSLGATGVSDGEVIFFDSKKNHLEHSVLRSVELAEKHVLASGALPPAFPPVEITIPEHGKEPARTDWFFDGGVSTNTPIEALRFDLEHSRKDTLVFVIDIWDRKGKQKPGEPRPESKLKSFDEVLWRQKSIQYGSRKKAAEIVVDHHDHRGHRVPGALKRLDVCQVMYETEYEEQAFSSSDADFSRDTFDKLRDQGRKDMQKALETREPVKGFAGDYASLYRIGSQDKHKKTDEKLAGRKQYPKPEKSTHTSAG